MKKLLAMLLAVLMILPLFSMPLFAVEPEEANGDLSTGLRMDGDGSLAAEEYYASKKLDRVPHTYEAWVYLPAGMETVRPGVILGNYTGVVQDNIFDAHISFEIQKGNKPRLQWYDQDGGKHEVVFSKTVAADTWTHVAIVHDETAQEVRCYLNGEYVQSNKDTSYSTFYPLDPTIIEVPLVLGGDHRNSLNPQYFKGYLKDVNLYADVRSAEEVAQDYASGPDLTDRDLLCYYDIDSSDKGKNIKDETCNGYDMMYSKVWMTEEEMEAYRGDTSDREYSFAVIGDTQYTTRYNPDNLPPLYQWIADNKEAKNIQYVMGLGDITDTDTNNADGGNTTDFSYGVNEWTVAKNAISILDGVVEYSLVRGNHDVKKGGSLFLELFGQDTESEFDYIDQFKKHGGVFEGTVKNYGGTEETASIANTWRTLEVGGDRWLLINLDYGAHDTILQWAGDIIKAHPDHRVIITTHGYLFADGTPIDKNNRGTVSDPSSYNNGDAIWSKLVSRYENVELVLCGHVDYNNIVVAKNKGINGNTVTQMLVNPQLIDRSLGGLGLVALFYFSEDGQSFDVEYYSTVKGMYFRGRNQMTVNLDAEGEEEFTTWDGVACYAPSGSGTAEDPYLVSNAAHLYWMSNTIGNGSADSTQVNPFAGMYFEQIRDIDLCGFGMPSIGYYFSPSTLGMRVFGGHYDGNGYSIKNGTITPANSGHAFNKNWGHGLFGMIYNATIENVVLDNVTVEGRGVTGMIVGRAVAPLDNTPGVGFNTISGCEVKANCTLNVLAPTNVTPTTSGYDGNTNAGLVGSIAGMVHATRLEYCTSALDISVGAVFAHAGGIVGSAGYNTVVDHCSFTGGITLTDDATSPTRSMGGIVGLVSPSTKTAVEYSGILHITNCYNSGYFKITSATLTINTHWGGIIGFAGWFPEIAATEAVPYPYYMENCYNLHVNDTAFASSSYLWVGGLVGKSLCTSGSTQGTMWIKNSASVDVVESQEATQNKGTNEYRYENKKSTYGYFGIEPVLVDGISTVTTKTADELEATLQSLRREIAFARMECRRAPLYIGYQKAIAENDNRIRLLFGLETLNVQKYGFELTLNYVSNGKFNAKKASTTSQTVYHSVLGADENGDPVALGKEELGSTYCATLVINPTLGGKPIAGEVICTVRSYTMQNGIKVYGSDPVILTFTDGIFTSAVMN